VRIGGRRVATVVRISRHRRRASVLVARSTGQRVVLAPSAGVAGSFFRLRGKGFRRGGHVRIRFAQRRVRRVPVGRGGRFATSGRVPSVRPGRRSITVRWRGRRLAMPFVLRAARGHAPRRRSPGRAPASPAPAPGPAPAPPASAPAPPVVAAAGDIACGPGNAAFNGGAGIADECRQQATGNLLQRLAPAAVLPLGDLQYETGALADFRASYAPAWGPLDPIAHPVPGDDEYETPGAAGYFDYFGARAGDRGRGYYSFDLGAWHLIALNSACAHVSCAAGSPQEEWLRADLAAHPGGCTLAYWHAPRFESGPPPQATDTGAFWDDLHAAGAEVVLGGNAHLYERFAPQDPSRATDPSAGIRQFVVGTGGRSLHAFSTVRPNSEVRIAGVFGALALTLRPGGYDWRFLSVSGAVLDAGSAPCH
jgi:acid phosphatase type 7